MLPANDQYDFCHGCGVHFRIQNWSSWNTIGGVLYSDGYFVAPMDPDSNVYFKCPECDAIIDKWSWVPKDLDEPMFDAPGLVDLELATFTEAFESVKLMARDGIGVSRLIEMRHQLWILGNHVRRDENRELPLSPYEIQNLELLLAMLGPLPQERLRKGMILRTLGRFEEAREYLVEHQNTSDFEVDLIRLNFMLQAQSDSRVGKWEIDL